MSKTLRYVSEREETVAERIEAVRKTIAPAAGRQSRLGYISKDDFAVLIGASRTRVIAWTNKKKPAYPEESSRIRLAKLSRGRYSPDDFRAPQRLVHLEELEGRVEELERLLNEALPKLDQVASQVEALETQAPPRRATASQKR